jgi:hypothetical protein
MTTRNYSSRSQQTTLTSAVTAGASSIVVQSGTALLGGQSIPAGTTFTIVVDPDTALEEILDATAVSTNTFTVTRAIDGSSAQAHSAGAVVRHMAIGRDYREANTHIEASTGVHGISNSSSVVGTIDTQTLTNKTLTSPTITNPNISGAGVDASIVFEGATPDAFETTLTVVDPTQDNTLTLPNTTGTVVVATAVQTLTNKTMGNALNAGGFKITNLATPTDASDAVRKDFADAQVAAAATSATSAATSATSAAASATTAANSVATIAGYATSSANSATAAATSATSAATSATSAANSATAAATSATSAAASATTSEAWSTQLVVPVSGSEYSSKQNATYAAASATSSAASATASANSATASATSASAAATSAASAATSAATAANSVGTIAGYATSAADSATAAATSATSAAASATAASTSAASAATSATSAATSYDDFDDRYLGSKSTAPTVDNDGNTLLVGAIYWNSTLNNMYVWSGSTWVQIATTSVYTAPTLGSTALTSGTTISTVTDLTLSGGLAAADPTTNLGLATKQYVDAVVTQINYHEAVVAATTANLTATYSNGTSGVGATLTNSGTQAAFSIDGISPVVNARILVKDQTTQSENGIYALTTVGSGSTNWVLTRATDADNNPSGEMKNGDELFCSSGTVNAGKSFINSTTVAPIVIGTTAITFSEYYAGLPAQAGNSAKYLTTNGTTPSWSNTFTSPDINTPLLKSPEEIVTVSATAATGTINYDALTQGVLYYTTNASANWTLNLRGNSSTTLNTMLATGSAITLVFMVTNGSTAYYGTQLQIDGTNITPKWQNGVAPTAGSASSIDAYTYTVIKTGSATYTVIASQTKFA